MKFIHDDLHCKEPISEHIGNEPCITLVADSPAAIPVAHYTQGAQGNTVADHHADFLSRSHPHDRTRPLGTPGLADRRDPRDPEQLGVEILATRNGSGVKVTLPSPRWTTHQ